MLIGDVFEMVRIVFRHEQRDGYGLDWRIAPTSIINAAQSIDVIDKVAIFLRPPQFEIGHFEIVVEYHSFRPPEPLPKVSFCHVLFDGRPQSGDARLIFPCHQGVGVADPTVGHHPENIVTDWMQYERVVVQSPDVTQTGEYRLVIDRLGVEPAHVTIADLLEAYFSRYGGPVDERWNVEGDALEEQQ